MESLIVIITETTNNHYFANAIGCPLSVQAESSQELHERLCEVIRTYFSPELRPRSVRLYFVREEELRMTSEFSLEA